MEAVRVNGQGGGDRMLRAIMHSCCVGVRRHLELIDEPLAK